MTHCIVLLNWYQDGLQSSCLPPILFFVCLQLDPKSQARNDWSSFVSGIIEAAVFDVRGEQLDLWEVIPIAIRENLFVIVQSDLIWEEGGGFVGRR